MSAKNSKDRMKTLGFRLDADTIKALEGLAEKKGVVVSDLMRGIISKVLAPVQAEQDAQAAELEALPESARKKALRAIEIQKRLRELRAERPKVHALSYLFQDGSGAAQDAKTSRLEAELAALKASFEAEVGACPGPTKPPKKSDRKEGASPVHRVEPEPEDDEEAEETLYCPKCQAELERPDPVADGGPVRVDCPNCGEELEVSFSEDDETDEEDGSEADDEEGSEAEADSEPAVVKTAAEAAADRFLELTGLINSLRACREPRSILDTLFNGGPPACDLLIKELDAARDAAALSDERLEELRGAVTAVAELRKKISEVVAAGAPPDGPVVKGLEAEIHAAVDEVCDEPSKKKSAGKKPGSFDWL